MFTTRVRRILRLVFAGFVVGGGIASGMAKPSTAHAYIFGGPHGTVRGGVDFGGFCRAAGWEGATLYGWSAGSWKCYRELNVPIGVDLTVGKDGIGSVAVHTQFSVGFRWYGSINADAACKWTWQDRWLVADFVNWYDAYSIRCVQIASHY